MAGGTLENNNLIAEFMGFKRGQNYDEDNLLYEVPDEKPYEPMFVYGSEVSECTPDEMSWNTSWDWLMAVVEKIENLDIRFSVTIKKTHCSVSNIFVYDPDLDINTGGENKLLFVYQAVVEFIKWYNLKLKHE